MTPKRLLYETSILEKFFPRKYKFENLGYANEFLDVGVKTQSGKVYRLNIKLKSDYPSSLPEMYVVYPSPLRQFDSTILNGISHAMHTLSNDSEKIQICHFKREKWNPNQSLYKIILKGKIWLEAYEGHLRTGHPIDYYLIS